MGVDVQPEGGGVVMQRPSSVLLEMLHGSHRRHYIRSLYRFERTAKRLGVEEKLVGDAYMNRFFSSMNSSTFCRLLLNGRLVKDKLRRWSIGGF